MDSGGQLDVTDAGHANQPSSMHCIQREQGLAWRPNRDTLIALVSYGLVVADLYAAFQVFTTDRVAANFVTFGPITLAGLGIALPVFYTRGLSMPFEATYGFLLTLGLMLVVIATGILLRRKRRQNVKAPAEEPARVSGAMPSAGD